MIYDINGTTLNKVYDVNGIEKQQVYDVEGNPLLSSEPVTLKVMTYNVGQWSTGAGSAVPTSKKEAYYDLQKGIFERNEPQVCCIQEYYYRWCQDDSRAADLLGAYFNDLHTTNSTNVYKGHAIATKDLPMANYTSHNFPSNRGNYPTYETCQITVGGKTINIVNTHNDYYTEYQPSEIATLLSAIQGMEYFILCGDFNTNIYYPADFNDTTTSQYVTNIKPFVDAGYNVGNCGYQWLRTYYGDTEATWAARDNIITSPNITFNSLTVDTAKLTDDIMDKVDHLPLIAEVTIS